MQEALLTLESDGAIVRRSIVRPNGQRQRVIYAATALLPSVERVGTPPALGVGGQPPWGGVGGHPRQVGAYNLKTPRMPKTELARARLCGGASGETRSLGAWHGRGLSEQRSDQRWRRAHA